MASSPPPNQPLRAELVGETGREPLRVILEQPRPGWLGRIVKWVFFALVALWILGALGNYGADEDGITEKWHSLSHHAPDKVAIIAIKGTILGDESFVKDQIDRVREDDSIKAVVVRVDSPGGTVTGSDYIYHHLKVLAEERDIPLVVSMGGIAASGGYYVAMAAGDTKNNVFAEPTTWTGSIGVIIPHYNLTGLLKKIEVSDDSIASNPLKMMGSPTRDFPEPIRAEEQKILQQLVDASFDDFKNIVLASRPALRDDEDAQKVAFTGRIFTAKQALDNHLVDKLGFVEDAILRAIELAALDKDRVQVIEYQQEQGVLNQILFGPQGRQSHGDLSALLELNVPRAYYLCTWMPGLDTRK